MSKELQYLDRTTDVIRDIYHSGMSYVNVADDEGNSNKKEVLFKDLVTDKDLARFIPEAVTQVLLDEIEPASIIVDNLFTVARITRSGSIIITDTGPLAAGPIGADGEYPNQGIAMTSGGYRLSLTTGKYGLALALTQDVLDNNDLAILSYWMRKAANALTRNREWMAMNALLSEGIVMFDNADPTGNGMWDIRNLTGRGIDGNQNGTFSLNDLMELYAYTQMEGFTMDTIMMNPLAWMTFMTDPEMREIVLDGNTVISFRPPLGNRAPSWTQLNNPLGLKWDGGVGNESLDATLMKLGLNPYARSQSVLGSTFNLAPKHFPTPLKIILSPYVPLRRVGTGATAKYVTDIIFAQAGEAGIFVRKEEPMTDRFNDSWKEITKVKMREEIGVAITNQGKAIRIVKNAVIGRNYVFDNVNSTSLSPLNRVQTFA